MKLEKILDLVRSTWIKQDNGVDGRVTIELITCTISDYIESPKAHAEDLVCAYVSEYKPEVILNEALLNRNVLGFSALNIDHIIIEIEDK